MKILITGGDGQLGSDCRQVLREKNEVLQLGSRQLDITDPQAIAAQLEKFSPDIVINCAAFTRVDACEGAEKTAWKVNALGPGFLADAMRRHGLLVHISTDYVFDGRRKPPAGYTEEDEPDPQTSYGRSKLAGEEAVRGRSDRFLIIRTAWLYGIVGHNFLKTILKMALQTPGKEIRVVNDQFGTPTWSFRLAEQIDRLLAAAEEGIFHASAEGYTTWYETARAFLDTLQVPHRIVPCSTAEYPTPAKRPANSILENRRLDEKKLSIMQDWRQDIREFAEKFGEQLIREVRRRP